MIVYVVTMHRFGDTEKHSYVQGAYDNKDLAIKIGRLESIDRGHKYEFAINEIELNKDYLIDDPKDPKFYFVDFENTPFKEDNT